MEKNYPKKVLIKGVLKDAHPSSDSYAENQCAIRLGKALMDSGIDLSSYAKSNKTSEGYPRSSRQLSNWIYHHFPCKPKVLTQKEFEDKYWNKRGIIFLDSGGGIDHIDLWNRGDLSLHHIYTSKQVLFWELP